MSNNAGQDPFDQTYYDRYRKKNIFGQMSGERAYLYSYWTRFLKKLLPAHATILDIGCGMGFFSKHLSQSFNVTGVDISEEAIRAAVQISPKAAFKKILPDSSLPFADASFDGIVAFDVIEHIAEPLDLVREIRRVLKPSGICILAMPNPQSIGAKLKGNNWYALTDPTHISLLTQEQWLSKFREGGLKCVRKGTDFLWDVPYVKWVPTIFQKLALVSMQWVLVWGMGTIPWKKGETLVFVLSQ